MKCVWVLNAIGGDCSASFELACVDILSPHQPCDPFRESARQCTSLAVANKWLRHNLECTACITRPFLNDSFPSRSR